MQIDMFAEHYSMQAVDNNLQDIVDIALQDIAQDNTLICLIYIISIHIGPYIFKNPEIENCQNMNKY